MISTLLLAALTLPSLGSNNTISSTLADSSTTVDIDEVVVVASPKQTSKLRNTATSVSLFSGMDMNSARIQTMSGLNGLTGNFFMPQYGSKLSSAVYIRGIGSRINTPAVALYVNDAPVAEKSEYSINFMDVNRIDVLRGPQGTLYGRNAMGGIIRLYTKDPFIYQGTDVRLSGATRNESFKAAATTYQKLSDKAAFSLGAFYETDNGFWRNDTLGHKVGGNDAFGGRFRFLYNPTQKWHLDFTASYEYSDEDAYPYFYGGSLKGTTLTNALDRITANRNSKYRRNMFGTSLLASCTLPDFIFSSVTGYRNLSDRMFMDQDFLYQDYYTLEQQQRANTLTEEITLKSLPGKRWEWIGGLFGLYEALRTTSPVTFYQDGVNMINTGIASHLPTPTITVTNPRTGLPVTQVLPMALSISDNSFTVPDYFHTPVLNAATFFQGTLHDFLIERLGLTLGLRLDYEHQQLYYRGGAPVNYHFTMPTENVNAMLQTGTKLKGTLQNDYTTLLPKFALQYDLTNDRGNLYATVSKGQRAGGYNIQMFSDIMSTVMQNDMMAGTKDYCDNLMAQMAAQYPTMASMFTQIRDAIDANIPTGTAPDIALTVTYKPEYCWNYEVGTHLNFLQKTITADFSVFYMDIRNQQIARFVSSGLGRIMVNAGRSMSCGLEAALAAHLLNDRLSLRASYGFTHSEFRRYDAGDTNYKGNYVPFIPMHNIGLMVDYTIPTKSDLIRSVTFGANAQGIGRIYWTEANNAYQNFYATLGAHVLLDICGRAQLNLWGNNLTCSKYKTFYFESMSRSFYQKCNPFQLGVDLSFHF